MMNDSLVFIDANALIYALDKTSTQNEEVVILIQQFLDRGITLCTSHHVIEEVLHIARKIGETSASLVIKEVSKIPDLVLIEPDAVLEFAENYAELVDKLRMGVNDALLLQLMLDVGITRLLSYDKPFVSRAAELGIQQAVR